MGRLDNRQIGFDFSSNNSSAQEPLDKRSDIVDLRELRTTAHTQRVLAKLSEVGLLRNKDPKK